MKSADLITLDLSSLVSTEGDGLRREISEFWRFAGGGGVFDTNNGVTSDTIRRLAAD